MTCCRVRAARHAQSVSVRRTKWPAKVARHKSYRSLRMTSTTKMNLKNGCDHALFVSFAPFDDPRIAVAVIVENGSSGSGVAAPIAKAVMDQYLGYGDVTAE